MCSANNPVKLLYLGVPHTQESRVLCPKVTLHTSVHLPFVLEEIVLDSSTVHRFGHLLSLYSLAVSTPRVSRWSCQQDLHFSHFEMSSEKITCFSHLAKASYKAGMEMGNEMKWNETSTLRNRKWRKPYSSSQEKIYDVPQFSVVRTYRTHESLWPDTFSCCTRLLKQVRCGSTLPNLLEQ